MDEQRASANGQGVPDRIPRKPRERDSQAMKLKRIKGKAIILRDDGSSDIMDVIVLPQDADEATIEALVHAACVDNDTATDDVTVDTIDHYYIVKDTRCPVVKYEFNPRPTKRSGTSPRGSRPSKSGPAPVPPRSTLAMGARANTSKTSRHPKAKIVNPALSEAVDAHYQGKRKRLLSN
jgi:hypothetical protein